MAGRVTLAQSILLSIPCYFMQSMMILQAICDEIEHLVRKFIWVNSSERNKFPLVSLKSICQPRACGRLGLRQVKAHNTSFMPKLAFILVANSSALWVCVLRSKYGIKYDVLDSINWGRCSFQWRALLKIWPLLCENIFWSVGDGNKIRQGGII